MREKNGCAWGNRGWVKLETITLKVVQIMEAGQYLNASFKNKFPIISSLNFPVKGNQISTITRLEI